jgi:hypothetical protein
MANRSTTNQTTPVKMPRNRLRISGRVPVQRGSAKINAVQITAAATETTFIGDPAPEHTKASPCVKIAWVGKAIEVIRMGIKKE